MGDEQQDRHQEKVQGQPQREQPEAGEELAFPDLEAGKAWGESITKERANELEARLQEWELEAVMNSP